jgi:hypothetical protein
MAKSIISEVLTLSFLRLHYWGQIVQMVTIQTSHPVHGLHGHVNILP